VQSTRKLSGSGGNGIVVTNLAGQKATKIDGQDDIVGIALSANGGTLYAAARSEHAVIAINTATLRMTATYRLPVADDPWNVAVQSGRIWVSYDVAGGRVTVRSKSAQFENCENQIDLAVAPGGRGFVLACGWPYSDDEYSTANLRQQWDARGLAWSADGSRLYAVPQAGVSDTPNTPYRLRIVSVPTIAPASNKASGLRCPSVRPGSAR
jgi:hypothetical protein